MTLLTLKPSNMVQNIILFTLCKYCCKSMKGFGTTTCTRRAMNHRMPVTSTGCRFKLLGLRFAAAFITTTVREESQVTPQGSHWQGSNWRPTASSSMPLPTWTRHPYQSTSTVLRSTAMKLQVESSAQASTACKIHRLVYKYFLGLHNLMHCVWPVTAGPGQTDHKIKEGTWPESLPIQNI